MINAVNEFLDDLRGGRMIDTPIVRVEEGELQGKLVNSPSGKGFYSFQGIPYAKPPIGSLRFRAPQPPEPWDGVRDATCEGNISAQIGPLQDKSYTGDENCLFLNIFTPNLDGEFLPVMVFLHGGAYRFGSGSASLYGGDYLVEKDVVIVTINYRVGPLGFLCLNTPEVPGNAGMKDMVQALRWIHQNIKNFGGNSGNLTIFGNSCGGAAVSMLTASPMSKNLMSKAIVQSGCALNPWAMQKTPIENARRLAEDLGCESSDVADIFEFLSTTPVRDIVEASERVFPFEDNLKRFTNSFCPVVEKEFPGVEAFMTEPFINILTSGRAADVPLMIGTTTLEFVLDIESDDLQTFIPRDLNIERNSQQGLEIAQKIKELYFKGNPSSVESLNDRFQLISDLIINIDSHRYMQYLLHVKNKPIYYYKFDYVGALNTSGNFDLKHAGHGDELAYLFSNDLQKGVEVTPQDEKMRERILRLWTNFAKTGNPTPDENHYITVTWLPANKDTLYYINLSNELSIATNPDKEKMEFWDELYSKYFKIWDQIEENKESEKIEYSTTPVIVEETIITTVTTVVSNSEEVTTSQVLIDVQDNSDELVQIQEKDKSQVNEIDQPLEKEFDEVIEQISIVEEQKKQEDEQVAIVEEKINNVEEKEKVNFVQSERKVIETEDFGINIGKISEKFENPHNGVEYNGNSDRNVKPRPSNEIKMVQNNNFNPKDVIRANDPPEDDLPKNIGVNKFVNFFESLGGKK